MKDEREILSLTGLRFIAALYVFIFHIHIRWPIANHGFVKKFLDQGAVGMSIFFMLSGFVLAYRYADGRCSLKDYLINRFARIYPIYVVAAVVTLPWLGINMGSSSATDVTKGIAQIVLIVFANIFLVQAWFIQFFSYWNNGGSWSISVEAFCYVMLPFLLPKLSGLSIREIWKVAFVCWILAVFPGLSAALFDSASNNVYYSMPIFRLPEFLIGSCIYLAVRLGYTYKKGSSLQITFLVVFLLYLGIAGPKMPLYVGHNWIAIPIIAFMIFSLSNGTGPIASILASRLFVWLGKISYSFYSFQVLIILSLISYHDRLIQSAPILSNSLILAAASFMALVMIAAFGYYFIEEPARRFIRKHQKVRDIPNIEGADITST